jgi:hypothetical protein
MDSLNVDDVKTLMSPIHSTNKGKQTPPPDNATGLIHSSSPLPDKSRPRQGSVGRKRTNEESWGPAETPQASPKSTRQIRRSVSIATVPEIEDQIGDSPFGTIDENPQTQIAVARNTADDITSSSQNGFVEQIHEYQRQLELGYQEFEKSLNEQDSSADLQTMDWENLEARYHKEISPCIDREKEIMDEFNARFSVGRLLASSRTANRL